MHNDIYNTIATLSEQFQKIQFDYLLKLHPYQ